MHLNELQGKKKKGEVEEEFIVFTKVKGGIRRRENV